MKIVKMLLIIIGVTKIFKAVVNEDFDDLFIGIFCIIVGAGLSTI